MLSLTTPALLFPAISLLMLAYTNRYLALASIIRGLYDDGAIAWAARGGRPGEDQERTTLQ